MPDAETPKCGTPRQQGHDTLEFRAVRDAALAQGRVGSDELVTHGVASLLVRTRQGGERVETVPLGPIDRETMRGIVDEAAESLRRPPQDRRRP
ncbi:hypothetical protein KALB_4842 [Kutzneria albida DSM 43870]|uniref:Uncharacterized protein n=1 Tax=Kutzneria albida DSM 43870 TaxID=1449976 RepID=W5WJ70_9PSEU|nr:hypothetical protein KALB_4842 [Kutzneria albida DSM 43870]